MDKPPRHLLRALRQCQIYGYLVPRNGGIYHPGGNHPVCNLYDAQQMVTSGWLVFRDGRYEITPEGHRAAELSKR